MTLDMVKASRDSLIVELTAAGARVTGSAVRCPFHKDRNASGSVYQDNGSSTWLYRCHGCEWSNGRNAGDVVAVVMARDGLTFPQALERLGVDGQSATGNGGKLWEGPERFGEWLAGKENGRFAGSWFYQDRDGRTVLAVIRVDGADGKKAYRPLHPAGDGWKVGDPPGKLPLYRLRDIGDAGRVVVVEGERCVDAARSIGLTATTSAHGAKSAHKSDWTPLAGRGVVILPDADETGARYARDVAAILTRLTPPATVRILPLPGLAPGSGDDIADYIEQADGKTCEEIAGGIWELADALAPWTPPPDPGPDAGDSTDNAPPTDSMPDPGPPWYSIGDVFKLGDYARGMPAISTGYGTLDALLGGGIRPQTVTIMAGRTGSAKSTLALNMTRHIATAGESVLFLKLEERIIEAVWRMHAAAADVPMRVFLGGVANTNGETRTKLTDGWRFLTDLPLRFSDVRPLDGIDRVVRQHAQAGGRVVFIDQLSHITVEGADFGYATASLISNRLRRLAVETNTAIVVVVQVNREASKHKVELTCNDLRDSGQLENDAAAVILINKIREPDGPVYGGTPTPLYLQLLIGKARYGRQTPAGSYLELLWWPRTCRIDPKPENADDAERRGEGVPL